MQPVSKGAFQRGADAQAFGLGCLQIVLHQTREIGRDRHRLFGAHIRVGGPGQIPVRQQPVRGHTRVDAFHRAVIVAVIGPGRGPQPVDIQYRIGTSDRVIGPADLFDPARKAPVLLEPFQVQAQSPPLPVRMDSKAMGMLRLGITGGKAEQEPDHTFGLKGTGNQPAFVLDRQQHVGIVRRIILSPDKSLKVLGVFHLCK